MRRRWVVLLMALLLLVGGCSLRGGNGPQAEQGASGGAGEAAPEPQSEQTATLELPMYAVDDPKLPTSKLGEPLRVGPVTVTAELKGGSYDDVTGYFRFHITVKNEGDGILKLDPRSSYWIAEESILTTEGPVDQRSNWFIVGRRSDGSRLLIYPDPDLLEELGYRDTDIDIAHWAVNYLDPPAAPLPDEVAPGTSAEGDILFSHTAERKALAERMDPDMHFYLLWGNWLEMKAWGRIDLGPLPVLYEEVKKQVGPNPPDPLNPAISRTRSRSQ